MKASISEKPLFSVALTETVSDELLDHLNKTKGEDLAFALWLPSVGKERYTAIITKAIFPLDGDRIQHGNVSFNAQYIARVLGLASNKYGIAFLHSHLTTGWQNMSPDDIIAEKDRLAGAVLGRTGLPLVGMTSGRDGSWSARFWIKKAPKQYERKWAESVRIVGTKLPITFHPDRLRNSKTNEFQVATASVWGPVNQSILANVHVGIVGLGSVGSIVAETLSRIGISRFTLIDPDVIEPRNVDRTLGSTKLDAKGKVPKVKVSERLICESHTANKIEVKVLQRSLLTEEGLNLALDCDIIFSCVDRPWPRHALNAMAYAHLIPVVDGGIFAKVDEKNLPIHVDWRVHTVGPGRKCLVCLGALLRGDISLDRDGLLDDPVYIKGLGKEFDRLTSRQNVIAFSLSVAAHEALQFIGMLTELSRVGGIGPQRYRAYPGQMDVVRNSTCFAECEYAELTASASDMTSNIIRE